VTGKTVAVTGATGGIGRVVSRELAGAGARLLLIGRDPQALRELADDLRRAGAAGVEVVVADLAERDEVEAIAPLVAPSDVFVSCAGIGDDRSMVEVDAEHLDRVVEVNLRAPMVLASAVVRHHLEAGTAARIVLLGSLAGLIASPTSRAYNAAKFGLRGFALGLRQDLGSTDIRVSLVHPGFVRDVGMFARASTTIPRSVRTTTAAQVARAVRRALDRGSAEVFAAPFELRTMAALSAARPSISERVQRGLLRAGLIEKGRRRG
jgi:short-subunit dehydrogenase